MLSVPLYTPEASVYCTVSESLVSWIKVLTFAFTHVSINLYLILTPYILKNSKIGKEVSAISSWYVFLRFSVTKYSLVLGEFTFLSYQVRCCAVYCVSVLCHSVLHSGAHYARVYCNQLQTLLYCVRVLV